jgi:hypothetical protein
MYYETSGQSSAVPSGFLLQHPFVIFFDEIGLGAYS